MKLILLSLITVSSLCISAQELQKPCCGEIDRLPQFNSDFVAARNIDIWIPEGYNTDKNYSVLYMHDGQMLYDASQTWNKQSWEVDDVLNSLLEDGKINDLIVVGIWNVYGKRHMNYFPEKPFEMMSKMDRDSIINQLVNSGRIEGGFQPNSDDYLKFVVTELKPYIDTNYSVYTDRDQTFIAGSSMGGLISLYAICEYPEIFGGAACMSTHWPGSFTPDNAFPDSFRHYLRKNLPDPQSHKIYFDYGDQTLDALYHPLQKEVDKVMIDAGYHSGNWLTRFFKGHDHSENSWKSRFDVPLLFLLGK